MARRTSEDYEGAAAYQLHLFATFDIEVLFAERLAWIDQCLLANPDGLNPADLQEECWGETCSLELRKGEITRTRFDDWPSWPPSEQSVSCEYVYAVPFRGNRELWHLRPSVGAPPGPLGEIHRLNLIIGMHGSSGSDADTQFQQNLCLIEELIDLQNREIAAFEARLPGIVQAKVDQMLALRSWSARGRRR